MAAAPQGWTGPLLFDEATGTLPSCPAATTALFQGGSGLVAPPAQCSTCSCDHATGISCPLTVSIFDSATCGNTPCGSAVATTTCTAIPLSCAVGTLYREVSSTPQGGSCNPASPQMPTVPPTTWNDNAEGCAATGTLTNCGSSQVCVPSPSTPFRLCIAEPASSLVGGCPAPYDAMTVPVIIDTGITDNRTCTACGCGDPASTCTGGSLVLSPQMLVCGGGIQLPNPSACAADGIPSTVGLYTKLVNAPTGAGTCQSNGGQPAGSAAGTNPLAVCCMP